MIPDPFSPDLEIQSASTSNRLLFSLPRPWLPAGLVLIVAVFPQLPFPQFIPIGIFIAISETKESYPAQAPNEQPLQRRIAVPLIASREEKKVRIKQAVCRWEKRGVC